MVTALQEILRKKRELRATTSAISNTPASYFFPAKAFIQLVLLTTNDKKEEGYYTDIYYLAKWLGPIKVPTSAPRTLGKLEGNNVTEAIAYWIGCPHSVLIDFLKAENFI